MSFVCLGVTHCRNCHSPLDDYGVCKECEEKEKTMKEKAQQKMEEKINQIVNLFFSLNEYEKEGLKERVCTVCSAKDTQKIAKLKPVENTSNTTNTTPSINPPTHEHKFTVEKSREDATCAKPGKIVYKCTECDKTKEEIIPATGKHDYDGGESCKVCGEKNPDYVKPTPTQNPPAPSENPPEVPEQAESKTE